jgi:hypothetical protein
MKESGKMTKEMEGVLRFLQMEIATKESTLKGKLMEKVSFIGNMEKFMMGSGQMELKKVMVFGKESREILI